MSQTRGDKDGREESLQIADKSEGKEKEEFFTRQNRLLRRRTEGREFFPHQADHDGDEWMGEDFFVRQTLL